MKKPRKLSDRELLDACRTWADQGKVFLDGKLAAERRDVNEYYLGVRPAPVREGGSKFVSQDVYLSVESMKTQVAETFAAGSKIVEFAPQGPEDILSARHATAYCEYAVHRRNEGLTVFQEVIHDGLTNRVGIAKVYWDKREEATVYQFEDIPADQAVVFLQEAGVRLTRRPTERTDEATGAVLWSGEYEVVEDLSQVTIMPVPPEEFLIAGRTRRLDRARYLAHRYRTTLGELVDDGYDRAKVYAIAGGDDDLDIDEEAVRREQDGLRGLYDEDISPDEAGRIVTVYESYVRLDVLGTGSQQLWKVVHCGDTMLEKQRVSDHPFLAYTPQPIPHTFWGNNFAARTSQHANVKTTLIRAIVEQAVEATNPRWQVARGGVANPRELIDNRRGGIVNVRDVNNSVAPLPQAPINPFVPTVIQMIDSDREDTTGISRLSQGLDKKALSHQNSQGLIEQLTDNSKGRAKLIARNFAVQFVTQLYLKIYRLALENESREVMLDIGGTFVPISPAKWRTRRDVAVDMTLGYGERDQRVAEMADLHSALQNSPKMQRVYGEKQAYNLWRDTLNIKGIRNVSDYLADPESLEPPAPDPKQEAEVAKLRKETEILDRQQALREQQAQDAAARENAELEWKRITGQAEITLRQQDADRKDREVSNRIDIALAELELALETGAMAKPENTKITAIASPNS